MISIKRLTARYFFDGSKLAQHVNNRELVQVVYAPGHMMLIKRHVLETVAEAYPDTEYKSEEAETIRGIFMPFSFQGRLYLDDYGFSARAVACGFTCWIDFFVRLRHRWQTWLEVPDHMEPQPES